MTVALSAVSKVYPGRPPKEALRDVTMTMDGVFGILGPNGAGKTTLLRIVATVLRPTAGQVTVEGMPLTALQPVRRVLGYLPQRFGFYPQLTVYETLSYTACLAMVDPDRPRLMSLLERVGLVDQAATRVARLSGGMVQRLGIACALVGEPRVLIVDEPTVGLDHQSRSGFRALLASLATAGRTVLFSTHVVSDAETVCQRLAVLKVGRVAFGGARGSCPWLRVAGPGAGHALGSLLRRLRPAGRGARGQLGQGARTGGSPAAGPAGSPCGPNSRGRLRMDTTRRAGLERPPMRPMGRVRWPLLVLGWNMLLIARGAGLWLAAGIVAAHGLSVGLREGNHWLLAADTARWCLVAAPLVMAPVLSCIRRRDESAGTADMVGARPLAAAGHVYAGIGAGTLALVLIWAAGATAAVCGALLSGKSGALAAAGIGLQALLVLPGLPFIAALAAVADTAWARQSPVLLAVAAAVFASLLYHPAMTASNLIPLFVPRYVSAVFGLGRHAYAVLANKVWSLGLALALTGAAALVCAARSPLHLEGSQRGLARALTAAGLARGAPGAEAIADAVRAVLPLLPEISPRPGLPFVIAEGAALDTAEMVQPGVLMVLPRDARLAASGQALRPVLRAMAEGYWWNSLFGRAGGALPAGGAFSPAAAVALFDQWRVLSELEPGMLAAELDSWRTLCEPAAAGAAPLSGQLDDIWRSGAAGTVVSTCAARQALTVWQLAQELGADTVRHALGQAASDLAPVSDNPNSRPVYWRRVATLLGVAEERLLTALLAAPEGRPGGR